MILIKKHITLSLLGLLISGAFSVCFSQRDLSIDQAIQTGLRNNFKIQIQKLEGEAIAYQRKTIYKKMLPNVNLSANQQNNINNTNSPTSFVNGFYTDNSIVGGVEMNWTLFDGFKIKIEKSRLEKMADQNDKLLMLQVENTVHAIMLAYYDVLLKQRDLQNARQTQGYSQGRLDDARYKFTKGTVSNYDVKRLKSSVLSDSTQCVIRKQFLEQAVQKLNLVMGNKNTVDYRLTDEVLYEKKDYKFSNLQHKMMSLNNELQNQYLNLYLKKNDVAYARSSRYPRIALNGGVNQNLNTTKFAEIPRQDSRNFSFYMNFAVSFNLFDGGEMKRQIQNSKIQQEIAGLKIEEIQRELSNQLRNVVDNYNNQLELIELNEALLQNLKEMRDTEADRYRSGFSSLLDFQQLKQEYERAEQTQIEAIFKLLQNEVEILKLTGGLLKYQ